MLIPGKFVLPKVRRSLREHKGMWQRLETALKKKRGKKNIVWVHAASAGEYIQCKPLIREFTSLGFGCVVTVTSISGYNWIKSEKNWF